MKSYNSKCIGCGIVLNDDESSLGYVPNYVQGKTKYCQRCFNIINYQKLCNDNLNVDELIKNFNDISFEGKIHIFHILDVLNLDQTIIEKLLNYKDKLTFVVNRIDCLPKTYNAKVTNEYIVKTLEDYGFSNPQIIYTSKNNNSSIKRLFKAVSNVSKQKAKAIFVGHTNVGKSSLINALKKLNYQTEELTVSPFINTTLNLKKNKIGNIEIIDTPGLPTTSNILNYLSPSDVKKVTNFKNNRPINFFLNPEQSIMLEGLGYFTYVAGEQANITFYMSNELHLERVKEINAERNLTQLIKNKTKINYTDAPDTKFREYEFRLYSSNKNNLSIDGLGLISLNKGMKIIRIKVRENVGVNLNKYAII